MTTDADRIADSLEPWQRRALLKPGVDGLAELSDRRVEQMVRLGLAAEYDIPTLGGFADDESVREMRRLGIAMVANTWTELGQAVAAALRARATETEHGDN